MRKSPNRKVFVSSKSDRGILVKVLDKTVSLSFWGNDNPKNISFSKEEALDFCKYITEESSEKPPLTDQNIFDDAFSNMKRILPKTHFQK
jgi:hypothetical protein